MNQALLYILVFTCLTNQVIAQKVGYNNARKKYPNQTYKSFLSNHPSIDYVHIRFVDKKPDFLAIYFRKDSLKVEKKSTYKYESYDLGFEGDVYLFQKRYKQIPELPQAEIDSMAGLQKCSSYYNLSATIYRDSIEYFFSQDCSSKEREGAYERLYKPGPVYSGDIKELARTLEEKYNTRLHQPLPDSIQVFRGLVNSDTLNKLRDITLIEGERTSFSDFIRQGIEESGKMWIPMFQGGRAVKSYAKIYVRLDSDGHITLSTPLDSAKAVPKESDR